MNISYVFLYTCYILIFYFKKYTQIFKLSIKTKEKVQKRRNPEPFLNPIMFQ